VRKLVIQAAATAEAVASAARLEAIEPGLGEHFRTELNKGMAKIREQPQMFRQIEPGIGQCRVAGFPYAIVFREWEIEQAVEVLAVMHLAREPGYWRARL
jgi:plasmid stabilization system protein ParE